MRIAMPKPLIKAAGFILMTTTIAAPALSAECSTKSPAQRVAVLELYTSEGCSSCPPADRWLSSIATAKISSDKLIALAFHVDYWDYIGWKDRFAKPEYSGRQREQVVVSGKDTVFTPQVMLNGKNYRGWRNDAIFLQDLTQVNSHAASVNIELNVKQAAKDSVAVSALANSTSKDTELYLALYENDLNSAVRAGENRGEQLHHDYVVRQWLGPFNPSTPANQTINLNPDWKTGDMGVVALVQNRSNGEILQAVASKLCS
ncbi:MAG: DUF1223 domain-containing protein [Methylobacter sp.]|nr:MAG: DUF1223 domain-containing protein [Methylobacter sp.]PPD20934.1 MAG: DUF1223 domain-containing protein [Methylobacter sp.]